jgi:hypothetical protein
MPPLPAINRPSGETKRARKPGRMSATIRKRSASGGEIVEDTPLKPVRIRRTTGFQSSRSTEAIPVTQSLWDI